MLRRNLLANLLGQGWANVMGFVFVPFYIAYLGVEAYGIIGFYTVLQSLFNILDFGMTPTLNRTVARLSGGGEDDRTTGDLLRSIEIVLISTGLLVMTGTWALSGWLATSWLEVRALPVETVAQTVALMGALAVMRLMEGPYRGVLIGAQRHVLLNALWGGFATLRGAGAVLVLAYYEASIHAFFMWQLVSGAVQLVAFAICAYAALPRGARNGHFGLRGLRGVWGFASGMFGISIAGLILVNADKVMLSNLLTLTDFGYYMLASMVAAGLYAIIHPIRQTWSPRLNQLHARGDDAGFIETYHRGSALVSVLAGSIALYVIAFADVILLFWTRDPVIASRASGVMQILLLANLVNGLVNMPMEAQLAHRWTRLALISELISIAIIFPLILIVTPRFGMLGAAWSLVALNLLYLGIMAGPMYRYILRDERWRWLFQDVLFPIGAAAASAFGCRWAFGMLADDGPLGWAVFVGGAAATLLITAQATPSTRRDSAQVIRTALSFARK